MSHEALSSRPLDMTAGSPSTAEGTDADYLAPFNHPVFVRVFAVPGIARYIDSSARGDRSWIGFSLP